ncbi:MAG: SDR family oxidoreductase [Hyphomicrobiaceae bacterium]
MAAERTALVTGASRRIGRAIALDLARTGWAVGVHYNRSAADARTLVDEVTGAGGRAVALAADLDDPGALDGLVSACAEHLGPVSCLINNASLFEHDTIHDLTAESWRRHMSVNLDAPVFLSRAFAQRLPRGATGTIVNVIDQRVWRLTPDFFSYTAAKAALWATTQMLAMALAPAIRVNAIGPGPVLRNIHQTEAEFDREWRATPLARQTSPEEIAAAVRFIIDAPSMTGQMIALDGGEHLAP